jgi:PAS domain-containing protein
LAMLGLAPSDNPFQADSLDRRLSGLAVSWLSILVALVPGTIPVALDLSGNGLALALVAGLWTIAAVGFFLSRKGSRPSMGLQARVRLHSGLAFAVGILLTSLMNTGFAVGDKLIAMIALGSTAFVIVSAMARLPAALVAFALGVAGRGLPLAQDWVLPTLGVALLCCFIFVAVYVGRGAEENARLRWVTDQEATRSNRLLDEVEQNSPSWFWETDRQGLITYISPKLSAWVGLGPGGLQNQFLTTITAEPCITEDGSPIGERTLAFYLSTRTAFSELAVPAAVEGHERWWSISGRPVLDSPNNADPKRKCRSSRALTPLQDWPTGLKRPKYCAVR